MNAVFPRRRRAAPATASATTTNVLLLGGSSEIALAVARRLALRGPVRPFLLGRDPQRLAQALALLESVGCADGESALLDADDLTSHAATVAGAFERAGGFDVVVLAIGVLGGQAGLDADIGESLEVMRVNFLDCGSLLLHALRELRSQGRGTLVVLSTVAAERPRASNPVYGAAKAGLDALAQGLADATVGAGVRVLVVRPGFVTTRMTEGLKPAPFATSAEEVAEATVRALSGKAHTVWVPSRLRAIFALLRHLPRALYRRLPL
jgi:NAD(P)-dependent dehydrogenase (short-subunit alcohol dehydrogenase family)